MAITIVLNTMVKMGGTLPILRRLMLAHAVTSPNIVIRNHNSKMVYLSM